MKVYNLHENLQNKEHPPERVILVDGLDQPLGTEEKIKAHQLGLLHRAFSVFIYRFSPEEPEEIEILMQQRHINKYHCGGLWSNSCCSHPRSHENIIHAAERRLFEELSLNIPLKNTGAFHYKVVFDNGMIENEYDYVLIGEYNEAPIFIDPEEVQEIKWLSLSNLILELTKTPQYYTPWLKTALLIALQGIYRKFNQKNTERLSE